MKRMELFFLQGKHTHNGLQPNSELYFGIQFGSIVSWCSFYCIECAIGTQSFEIGDERVGIGFGKQPFNEFNELFHASFYTWQKVHSFFHSFPLQRSTFGFPLEPCRRKKIVTLESWRARIVPPLGPTMEATYFCFDCLKCIIFFPKWVEQNTCEIKPDLLFFCIQKVWIQ